MIHLYAAIGSPFCTKPGPEFTERELRTANVMLPGPTWTAAAWTGAA